MKTIVTMKQLTGALLAGVLLMVFSVAANAAPVGTPSGTSIANRASVAYSVNSIAQTAIESSPTGNTTSGVGNGTDTTFLVDTKLQLTVVRTDGAIVSVTPGSTNQVLTFTVTNNGNSTQDVLLSSVAEANGTADPFGGANNDNFDATLVGIFVENGNQAGYQSSGGNQDTATYIDELSSGSVATVYIVANISATRVNNDVAVYALKAQEAVGGTATVQGAAIATDDAASADVTGTVQKVFADAAGTDDALHDGFHSARDAFKVATAVLTITKSSQVISDPINLGVNPKAIPGATIRYTIQIQNSAAGQTATGVTVTDSLNSEITAAHLAWVTNSITVTAPNINGGAQLALSDAADADQGTFAANVVTVNGITLNASEIATVTFDVTVQ